MSGEEMTDVLFAVGVGVGELRARLQLSEQANARLEQDFSSQHAKAMAEATEAARLKRELEKGNATVEYTNRKRTELLREHDTLTLHVSLLITELSTLRNKAKTKSAAAAYAAAVEKLTKAYRLVSNEPVDDAGDS